MSRFLYSVQCHQNEWTNMFWTVLFKQMTQVSLRLDCDMRRMMDEKSLFCRCFTLLFFFFFVCVRVCICLNSCDGADRLTAYIAIGGNKEKIDDFCGAGTPRELMSNSAQMSLHFHSGLLSRGARGFKARYHFVSSKLFPVFSILPSYPV